ncbi:MAG: type III pantothenate kinase [Acutalibacteraceae bacterium]
MILAIDIGNTNITLGGYKDDELVFISRMYTARNKTSEEYATGLLDLIYFNNLSPEDFSGVVLSSVVPQLTEVFSRAVSLTIKKDPIIVGADNYGGLKVTVLPISSLGADLIAGCVGALAKYPTPCIVADLGTATKLLVLDKDGYFSGCIIAPGVKISLDALASSAALLPSISFTKPDHVIGTNTVECMQSGSVYGTAAMLDGLIKRIKNELGEDDVTVVATGGYSKGIIPCCEEKLIFDENLVLDGLRKIYKQAQRTE